MSGGDYLPMRCPRDVATAHATESLEFLAWAMRSRRGRIGPLAGPVEEELARETRGADAARGQGCAR